MRSEVTLRSNQFGGVRGVGTDHLLVEMWQRILKDLEDYRAATIITSIDYSKAFNRMSFQECLASLARNGASTGVLRLVATFLTNRTMTVKVGSTLSSPLEVTGGCPQGSILGVFLFNATIDDLEAGCQDLGTDSGTGAQDLEESSSGISGDSSGGSPSSSSDGTEQGLGPHDVMETVGSVWRTAACSTPIRGVGTRPRGPDASPVLRLHGITRRDDLRNRRRKRKPARLNYTGDMRIEVPKEKNHWTEAKWQATLAELLRYVDDGFSMSRVNFENSFGFEVNGVNHRVKHAIQSQNVFRHLVRNAENIGMKVNTQKTTLVCFSDSLSFKADAYIEDSDGNVIRGTDKMKALGMRLSNRPDMEEHVKWIEKSVRSRLWMLRNLKKAGFNIEELLQVYKTIIRPVAEYGAVVYHSCLTDDQDERLDRLQNAAMKCVFGPFKSARKMRRLAGILSLRERRIHLCDKFVKKALSNPRFQHWFPQKLGRRTSTRAGKQSEVFLEEKARCKRLFDSPLFYFRRRLNGKAGKTYGKRNEEYRNTKKH